MAPSLSEPLQHNNNLQYSYYYAAQYTVGHSCPTPGGGNCEIIPASQYTVGHWELLVFGAFC